MLAAIASTTGVQHARVADASVPSLLAGLLAEAAAELDRDRELARALLSRAVALLRRDDEEDPSDEGSARPRCAALAPWQVQRVARRIDEHLDRSLPLCELAGVAGLSTSYFSRAFKGSFGEAPHAFITLRRIERARREMLLSDQPLSQIALNCGFADQAHLSRVFRRQTGRTPNAWRRANRSPPPEALA